MNARTRFLLGGIGGLAPIILFLINLDFERYVADASTWKTVGYLVRATLLFLLGGFVAYLHEGEKNRITLFLVGVSAPSLIAGYISTANPAPPGEPKPPVQHSFLPLIATAHAQPLQLAGDIRRLTLPPQTATAQFFEGLVGVAPKNIWFVIVGSHLDVNEARRQAAAINAAGRYRATIYAPYRDNPYYAVAIGSHLTQAEARALRDQAVRDGLPRSSYFQTFPGLPAAQ